MKFSMRNNKGLTLIEVLIALAILSIALTAIIYSSTQNIKNTIYLQNKMIAAWVGMLTVNEIRAGVLKVPEAPDRLVKETNMLGLSWESHSVINSTPNPHIKKIDVDVYQKSHADKLIHWTTYIYAT